MARSSFVLYLLGFMIFCGWSAHYFAGPPVYPGLACPGGRVATTGWTNRDRALAELAAILRWKEKASEMGPAFGEWHNARERYLKCRTIGGPRGHYQCQIAAMPCAREDGRKDESGA